MTINTTQQLRNPNDITSVQSKFALKYRLMSFYEIRDIIEDVIPCTEIEFPLSKDAGLRKAASLKDSKDNLDVSGGSVGPSNQVGTWVEVEVNDCEKMKSESQKPNETPTTSITTATSGN